MIDRKIAYLPDRYMLVGWVVLIVIVGLCGVIDQWTGEYYAGYWLAVSAAVAFVALVDEKIYTIKYNAACREITGKCNDMRIPKWYRIVKADESEKWEVQYAWKDQRKRVKCGGWQSSGVVGSNQAVIGLIDSYKREDIRLYNMKFDNRVWVKDGIEPTEI